MAIGALRIPVRIADSYVRPGDEQRLFPNVPEYLCLEDILSAWPRGLITHEKFLHKGTFWRLMKRPMANGNSVYMAVIDDPGSANGNGAANGHLSARCTTPDSSAHRLRSMPVDGFSPVHDGSASDLVGTDYISDVPAQRSQYHRGPLSAQHSFHHAPSAPAPLSSHGSAQHQLQQRNGDLVLQPYHSSGPAGLRERNTSYNSMAIVPSQPSGGISPSQLTPGSFSLGCGGNGFMTDLLAATESPMPLDRFKAFVRLFSTLGRMREALRLPATTPRAAAEDVADPAWESPEAQDLVRQLLMVGECLAKFGTADFVEARNNSSRAITTKDYAQLLRMYLETYGAIFRDDFISRMPLSLQDEALSVRTLLQTRCETNDLLFNQLIKHVGQEPAAGGAVVFNNSNVTANPTNHMLAAPRTFVNTVSNAWSKADVKRRTQLGALGGVAVVALWVLKRKLFGGGGGGGGGGRGRYGRPDDSEWGGGGSGRRISRSRGDLAARLFDEHSTSERMAVRFLSACHDEIRRAQHNDVLLRKDWRLGPLRLALPGSSNVPEGYEPVQPSYCSVASYMNAIDGGAPLALPPYNSSERASLSSLRESPALTAPASSSGTVMAATAV